MGKSLYSYNFVSFFQSPNDANLVRPADIQYIAAMGDSYTVGALLFYFEFQ